VATLAATIDKRTEGEKSRRSLAYGALLLFTFFYYTRPEDLIPGLSAVPIEKIIGGVALVALAVTLASGRDKRKFPLEFKLLLLLFAHLIVSIPFAFWRTQALVTVFERFSKDVIIAFLVTLIVTSFDQLRRLLWVQAASMGVTTIASILVHHTDQYRLIGALGGIFENPNDLAINMSINWPLVLAFLLGARGLGRKGIWSIAILGMLVGVILTYSRSGLLAMVMAVGICLWEFGIKGKRFQLIVLAFILSIAGVGVVVATPHYLARVESIFGGNVEGSEDRGSWEARRELLVDSIEEAIHHPITGIGAGNFAAATLTWHVAHNSYTEFAAEGGFPALILFLAILALAFRNIKKARSSPAYRENGEFRLFTGALWASLSAFVVGALFASFEYQLFPYFMVAYTSVLYRLASENTPQGPDETSRNPTASRNLWKRYSAQDLYGNDKATKLEWTR